MRDGRPTIWVIAAEPVLAEITTFRLELLGYDVVAYDNPDAPYYALKGETIPPEVIVIEKDLCESDAFELISRFRAEPQTADTPMMVLSPDGDLDGVQRAYHAGAREFLVTPFDPAMLEAKIESLLELSTTRK